MSVAGVRRRYRQAQDYSSLRPFKTIGRACPCNLRPHFCPDLYPGLWHRPCVGVLVHAFGRPSCLGNHRRLEKSLSRPYRTRLRSADETMTPSPSRPRSSRLPLHNPPQPSAKAGLHRQGRPADRRPQLLHLGIPVWIEASEGVLHHSPTCADALESGGQGMVCRPLRDGAGVRGDDDRLAPVRLGDLSGHVTPATYWKRRTTAR